MCRLLYWYPRERNLFTDLVREGQGKDDGCFGQSKNK